jgi:serine/threonine protein kinase
VSEIGHGAMATLFRAEDLASGRAVCIDYAHDENVLHRDIKPENVLLEDDRALVCDFGLARAIHRAAVEPFSERARARHPGLHEPPRAADLVRQPGGQARACADANQPAAPAGTSISLRADRIGVRHHETDRRLRANRIGQRAAPNHQQRVGPGIGDRDRVRVGEGPLRAPGGRCVRTEPGTTLPGNQDRQQYHGERSTHGILLGEVDGG